MFGGFDHISAAAEVEERQRERKQQQREAEQEQQQQEEEDDQLVPAKGIAELEAEISQMSLVSSDEGRTSGALTREEALDFFSRNATLLRSVSVRSKLKKLARTDDGKSDLNSTLIKLQTGVFPLMGINPNFGVQCLNSIPQEYAEDDEMLNAFVDFTINCSAAYCRAIKDNDKTGTKLQKSGKMTRNQIMNFVDAVNFSMMQPETHAKLHAEFETLGAKAVNEMSVNIQKAMLETLGIDKDYGISKLNSIQKDFPNDQELFMKMRFFFQMAQKSVHQATMDPEKLRMFQLEELRSTRERMQAQSEANAMREAKKQEVLEKVKQVKAAIDGMSPEEKDEFVSKWQPKWDTLRRLPPEEQMAYIRRQSAEDQSNYAKINFIKQMEQQNQSG